MPENKLLDVGELVDREISSKRCLFTLFTHYSDSYICFLDHSYVIPSISNGTCPALRIILDVSHYFGFLSGRASTTYY